MKDFIFSLIWAAICAWLLTKSLIWFDGQFACSSMEGFAQIINKVHTWGFAIKKIVFIALVLFFMLTNVHRLFGHLLGTLIIWGTIFVIIVVVGVVGWYFLVWLASSL